MQNPEVIRPTTIQVSAIGGEGGGVLSSWIVAAAKNAGLPVQSTSIPGVAQRTGATIYYIEIFPLSIESLGNKRPVMALYPGVGDIDIMVASEIIEAGRAISNGFVTPDRTHLIASTHRIYAIGERSDMGDGRYDLKSLNEAAASRAKKTYLADLREVARQNGVSLNAVLFGVLAGIGHLPMKLQDFRVAIETSGIAVDSNLKGFDIGYEFNFTEEIKSSNDQVIEEEISPKNQVAFAPRIRQDFPKICQEILTDGVRRLTNYQGDAYAQVYLDHLSAIIKKEREVGGDGGVTAETGRQLALRMTYEDVIRVAQLKTMPERLERIRREVKAGEKEPIVVVDYLKPGIDELCSILPATIGGRLAGLAERRVWRKRSNFGIRLKSTTIFGYLVLRILAGLRRWRCGTYRYSEEQGLITNWLEDVDAALSIKGEVALEVVECARLIKGYGDTYQRGLANYNSIREKIILPLLAGSLPVDNASDAIANARAAALGDPEGTRLDLVLTEISNLVAHGPSE